MQSRDIPSLPGLAGLVSLEDEDLFRLFHKITENTAVTGRADRSIINVVILITIPATRLAQNQLVILDTMVPQPFNSLLPMLLGPGGEEADVMALLVPLINLSDRVRIRTRVYHLLRVLIIDVFTDATVDVDDEYLPQSCPRFYLRFSSLSLR